MNLRDLLFIIPLLCWAIEMQCVADEVPTRSQIALWVQQLGDDSFVVRQRAETFLIQTGIQAYPELQRAKQSGDVEVARRAEYILSRIEQAMLDSENQKVAIWLRFFITNPNPAFKARIIWILADPGSDLYKGEGLQTLCRFVQFEENEALRIEAAKCLIASPPLVPSLRQKWYQDIRTTIYEPGDNTMLQCLVRYAQLWCDLDEAEIKTTPEFHERVRQVGSETLQLLKRPENNIQIGSKIDLLLHYAVAELYDAAGLTEERDQTVAQVQVITPQPIRTPEPIETIMSIVDDNLLMSEHFYVGWYLKQRYRLHWAKAHFEKVIETGDILLRVHASKEAAENAIYLADYTSAIAFLDKHIEILKSPEYARTRGDSTQQIVLANKRRGYCIAVQAADAGDWEKVQQFIGKDWIILGEPNDKIDVDLAILTYRLFQNKPDTVEGNQEKLNEHLKLIWQAIENDYHRSSPEERSTVALANMCNAAAWLLANTGGDYSAALSFAERAKKAAPEDLGILDTVAHVYFLGGRIDDAIRTQELVVRSAPEVVIFQKALERFRQAK